jgi:hypothetical protein
MELDIINYIIETYEDTVERLLKTGYGNETEFGNIVTEKMITNVIARMNTLKARRLYLLNF